MGNCFVKLKKSPAAYTNRYPPVQLYGSASSTLTAYIRFALLHKNLTIHFVPTDTPPFAYETPVLQIGSETVSGYRETLLHFIETKFPNPPLAIVSVETTPLVVRVTWLQHQSVMWHIERMVRWTEDLATRRGKKAVDPAVGSPRMEVKKFEKSYSQLLEVMLEHARMEETVVFPVLDRADRGICKAANEEHARDLPIMNGIKEDIKSIGVMEYGSATYKEAMCTLAMRLKSLQKHCKQHFEDEEKDLLPLIEATDLNEEQQKVILGQCYDSMKATHSNLFDFFLEGLLPKEAMQYLDIFMKCSDQEQIASTPLFR
ncbi:hypothetical protein SLE2022_067470 [Rubroshorea leprosula]